MGRWKKDVREEKKQRRKKKNNQEEEATRKEQSRNKWLVRTSHFFIEKRWRHFNPFTLVAECLSKNTRCLKQLPWMSGKYIFLALLLLSKFGSYSHVFILNKWVDISWFVWSGININIIYTLIFFLSTFYITLIFTKKKNLTNFS